MHMSAFIISRYILYEITQNRANLTIEDERFCTNFCEILLVSYFTHIVTARVYPRIFPYIWKIAVFDFEPIRKQL